MRAYLSEAVRKLEAGNRIEAARLARAQALIPLRSRFRSMAGMLVAMRIYTRTGDEGTTGLYGGERVSKDSLRVRAFGAVDEANAALGVARAQTSDAELAETLAGLQNALFDLGADLATPQGTAARDRLALIESDDVAGLEELIDRYEAELEPLRSFIVPGGTPVAAALHLARAIARRAEREVVGLNTAEPVGEAVGAYLNRLSDLLFVLARVANARAGQAEPRWQARRGGATEEDRPGR